MFTSSQISHEKNIEGDIFSQGNEKITERRKESFAVSPKHEPFWCVHSLPLIALEHGRTELASTDPKKTHLLFIIFYGDGNRFHA
jgi:hypothetical protein